MATLNNRLKALEQHTEPQSELPTIVSDKCKNERIQTGQFCSNHSCQCCVEEGRVPVLRKNQKVCVDHQCRYGDVIANKGSECIEAKEPSQNYCYKHCCEACLMDGLLIDYPLTSKSKYCDFHECRLEGCISIRDGCYDTQTKGYRLFEFCERHVCRICRLIYTKQVQNQSQSLSQLPLPRCVDPPCRDAAYCVQHRCGFSQPGEGVCLNRHLHNSSHCRIHSCRVCLEVANETYDDTQENVNAASENYPRNVCSKHALCQEITMQGTECNNLAIAPNFLYCKSHEEGSVMKSEVSIRGDGQCSGKVKKTKARCKRTGFSTTGGPWWCHDHKDQAELEKTVLRVAVTNTDKDSGNIFDFDLFEAMVRNDEEDYSSFITFSNLSEQDYFGSYSSQNQQIVSNSNPDISGWSTIHPCKEVPVSREMSVQFGSNEPFNREWQDTTGRSVIRTDEFAKDGVGTPNDSPLRLSTEFVKQGGIGDPINAKPFDIEVSDGLNGLVKQGGKSMDAEPSTGTITFVKQGGISGSFDAKPSHIDVTAAIVFVKQGGIGDPTDTGAVYNDDRLTINLQLFHDSLSFVSIWLFPSTFANSVIGLDNDVEYPEAVNGDMHPDEMDYVENDGYGDQEGNENLHRLGDIGGDVMSENGDENSVDDRLSVDGLDSAVGGRETATWIGGTGSVSDPFSWNWSMSSSERYLAVSSFMRLASTLLGKL